MKYIVIKYFDIESKKSKIKTFMYKIISIVFQTLIYLNIHYHYCFSKNKIIHDESPNDINHLFFFLIAIILLFILTTSRKNLIIN